MTYESYLCIIKDLAMPVRKTTAAVTVKIQQLLKKRPFIIAGPCSAESENQLLSTALKLAATGKVDVLRAGVWKPRTKPGMFEGAGSKALKWLQKVKSITGLPVMAEPANAKQVEECLSSGIDMLWLGARTTVNPFSVQEIADALQGTGIPVFIKNPLNPDIELWCGAVERIAKTGIKDIGLIHRGFSAYGDSEYRNPPMWHLAIEMRRRYPGLMMINDPSHICGNRSLLPSVMQQATDYGFDGLMIECHINPSKALTDAEQQITPKTLAGLLGTIKWRSKNTNAAGNMNVLDSLRRNIDILDEELLQIISQRMKIADRIGQWKKENNISILQTKRWQQSLERSVKRAEKLGLSREFIFRYWEALHLESINHQKKILDS